MRFSEKNEGNEGGSQSKAILSLYYPSLQVYIAPIKRKKKNGRIICSNPFSLAEIKSRRAYISLIQFQYIPHFQSPGFTTRLTPSPTTPYTTSPPSLLEFSAPSHHYIFPLTRLDSIFHHENVESIKGGFFFLLYLQLNSQDLE